jgi:hypothetical protein
VAVVAAVDGAAALRSAGKQPIVRAGPLGPAFFIWRKSLPAICAEPTLRLESPRGPRAAWARFVTCLRTAHGLAPSLVAGGT